MSPKLKQIGFAIMTFAVYSMLMNWKIAALVCIGIGWHEYSHILAANYLGLKTKGFYLVPFMGGVAFISDEYKSYFQRVFVVIMGPVGGALPGFALAGLYYVTGEPWLAAAAEWILLVNLFNLLPLSFLDGGQIMESITYSINETLGLVCLSIGTVLAAILLFKLNIVLFAIVMFMGTSQVMNAYNNWKYSRSGQKWKCTDDYLNRPKLLTKKQMFISGAVYIATIVVIGLPFLWLHAIPEANLNYFTKH